MLNNLNLSKKFNLLLILVVLGGIILSGVAFSSVLNQNAQNEVTSKAVMLMQTMSSIRQYTNDQITPLVEPLLDKQAKFLPQSIPAYSAREVFDNFRQNAEYKDFLYKEATLNPTNSRDKADRFESQLVDDFRKNPNLTELTGDYSLPHEELFYIARPNVVSEASCLRCHSTPEVAPKSQIATYGSNSGFGWKLNEIIGVQIIYVPASAIMDSAHRAFLIFMGIVVVAFVLAVLITNILLRLAVIKPIKRIVHVANEVSTGNMEAEFEQNSQDEIGMLATAFNRMKTSIAIAMDMLQNRR